VDRAQKGTTVAMLKSKFSGARGAVLTDYRGLSVAELTELRTLLRKSAVEYAVVKNTLAKLAIQDTQLANLATYLEGPTGIAISQQDPVAPSRILTSWAKNRPTFTLKAGVVEGQLVSAAEVQALADLPSREVLLARLAGTFQAPIQGLVNVLAGPVRALASVLDQVRVQKEKAQ
jgi:large subunit ribosomal protein L10